MTLTEYQTLSYQIDKDVLCITLNRPEKRNAFNEQMVSELNHIFLDFRDNTEILCVSITGSGDSFCAGADLSYLQSLQTKSYEENLEDSKKLKEMYWNIYRFPRPTIGLINGPAVAGGCGLVTVLDVAIASKNAIFGYPEVKIGFVASIVSVFLVQLVGLAKSRHLLYTGEIIEATEAERIGLISNIVDENEMEAAAQSLYSQIRRNSPQAIFQTKKMLREIHGGEIREKLDQACIFNADSRKTNDFKEGLQSFLEKRKPIWEKAK